MEPNMVPVNPNVVKKPFYKKWWFILLAVFLLLGVIISAVGGGDNNSVESKSTATNEKVQTEKPSPKKEETPTIILKGECSQGKCVALWGSLGSSNSTEFTGVFEKEITDIKDDEIYSISVTGDFMSENQKYSCEIIYKGKSKETNSAEGSAGSAHCQINPWEL